MGFEGPGFSKNLSKIDVLNAMVSYGESPNLGICKPKFPAQCQGGDLAHSKFQKWHSWVGGIGSGTKVVSSPRDCSCSSC